MNIKKLTYDQNSKIRGRVFQKMLTGSYERIKRAERIYARLESIVHSGFYPETIYYRR